MFKMVPFVMQKCGHVDLFSLIGTDNEKGPAWEDTSGETEASYSTQSIQSIHTCNLV